MRGVDLRRFFLGALGVACGSLLAVGSCKSNSKDPKVRQQAQTERACDALEIDRFVPEKARFAPGSTVRLLADVRDTGGADCTAALRLTMVRLGEVVHESVHFVSVSATAGSAPVLEWRAPDEDFRGYMAVLSANDEEEVLSTGVDVSSTSTRFPRYGFLSVFPPGQSAEQSREIVSTLAQQFHLNMFQLYDWFWRHEDLIPGPRGAPPPAEWTDLFGRVQSAQTLRDLISAIHDENALAMAYVAIYAAREGYDTVANVSPAWGLYETPAATNQVALAFGGERYLFLFDPANPAWQAHMAAEYVDALRTFPFDGVHIDQFGPRPTLYRADGSPVELNETFAPFLEAIDEALTREVPGQALCIFNLVDGAVNGYAVEAVASTSACDILYSELWFATDTYEQIRAYVEQLRAIGRGRPVVLAVYAQYGEDVGTILQAEDATLAGVGVSSNHPGYTGAGFVDRFETVGDSITWNIDLAERATVTFVFRYANATGEAATRTLFVDGEAVGKVMLGARGSWDDWSSDAWVQQRLPAGRHQVRLAFTESDNGAVNIDRLTLGEFDEDSVRLQNAVVFASGATPIQLGDDVQSLAHEYFPNRSKVLTPALQRALRRQYSFITAHEELLFSPSVMSIDARLDRISAVSEGHRLITEGVGGIWTVLRSTGAGDVIHLVNMVGLDNPRWRDASPKPEVQEEIVLRYDVEDASAIQSVLWATPDSPTGTFQPLSFTTGEGFVEIRVPRLEYWDVILLRR